MCMRVAYMRIIMWKTWDVREMVVFRLGLPSLAFVLGLA